MNETDKLLWNLLCKLSNRLHGETTQLIEDGRFKLKFEEKDQARQASGPNVEGTRSR